MKHTQSTKVFTIAKKMVQWGALLGMGLLSFLSAASLILLLGQFDLTELLPQGAVMTFSGYEAWGGVHAFVFTFVLGNTLMIYGLIKLKAFAKDVEKEDLLADSTISFLRKGALLMLAVGLVEGITEFVVNPGHIWLQFSPAAWLFIASLVLSHMQQRYTKKIA